MKARVSAGAGIDNAVSRKLFGHVNVVDVDIGGLRRGDSSLDNTIETSRGLVNCCPWDRRLGAAQTGAGSQSPQFVPHAPHPPLGIQACETAVERTLVFRTIPQQGECSADLR